jgi:hypothetical protein
MKTGIRLALALLLVAGAAGALAPGAELFVRARNTRVQKDSSPTAGVVAVLQPGQKVVWNGPDPKSKLWHRVTVGELSGVVYRSNLSEVAPSREVVGRDGGTAQDSEAFVSSGAGTRALSDGPVAYGEHKLYRTAVDQVLLLEALAREVGEAQIAAHVEKAGLHAVVGSGKEARP